MAPNTDTIVTYKQRQEVIEAFVYPPDISRKVFIRKVSCEVDADLKGPKREKNDHIARIVKQLDERHVDHTIDTLHERNTALGAPWGPSDDHGRQCCIEELRKQRAFFVKGFQGTAAESQPQPKPRFSQYSVSSILVVFTLAVLVLVIFLFHGRAKSPYGGDTVEDSSTRSEL